MGTVTAPSYHHVKEIMLITNTATDSMQSGGLDNIWLSTTDC